MNLVFELTSYNFSDKFCKTYSEDNMDRVKRIWYLSPMRAAKVQASLRIRAVSSEPSLLAQSRGTFRQKAKSLAPLNGWAYAVKICHDGMLEDTNSLDGAHIIYIMFYYRIFIWAASSEFGLTRSFWKKYSQYKSRKFKTIFIQDLEQYKLTWQPSNTSQYIRMEF